LTPLQLELSSDLGAMATREQHHVGGETSVAPVMEASPSPDTDQAPQASTSCSRLFLRRGGREIALSQGELLDGLEEFEALPLKGQRRTLESNLLKVSVD